MMAGCSGTYQIGGENLYEPKQDFMEVLKVGGASGRLFTMREILKHLVTYLKLKNMFDSINLSLVNCKNDTIGQVFGVDTFSKAEVLHLIKKHVSLTNQLSLPPTKRKCVESYDDENSAKIQTTDKNAVTQSTTEVPTSTSSSFQTEDKKLQQGQLSPLFFSKPDYAPYDSGSDSALSMQGYETAVVKDSSDEFYDSSTTDDISPQQVDTYELEFEIASSDGSIQSCPDTESDIEEVVHTTVIAYDSDVPFWADDSDDNHFFTENDPELTDDDWECSCGEPNKVIHRHCFKCWKLRPDWLPDTSDRQKKPRKKRKKRKQLDKQRLSSHEASSQNTDDSPESQVVGSIPDDYLPSPPASISSDPSSSLCQFCLTRSKCAALIHGRTGHLVSCYPCAKKLDYQKKPCPVCRRTVSRVIKMFFS